MGSHWAFIWAAATLAAASASPAAAEPVCQTIFPDGRVMFTRPMIVNGGLSCPNTVIEPRLRQSDAARFALPTMSFTTGSIGPFTTGSIGPFTSGEIGPFTTGSIAPVTTFSNSAPATPQGHR